MLLVPVLDRCAISCHCLVRGNLTKKLRGKEVARKAMYVTVRRYEGVTDPSEAGRQVEEGFIPIISEMPGFVAYYWVDAGDGVMISTSVFEHKDAEEQSNWRAGDFVAKNLASLLPNPPQVTAGELVAHKAT
jgi:hypothetical protein